MPSQKLGMAIPAWLKAMPKIVTFAATESTLTLNAAEGPVASFRK